MDRHYNHNSRRQDGHDFAVRDYNDNGRSMNRRSRSRERDYNNRDYNSGRNYSNRRSRSRSRSKDRSRRGYGPPDDDYDSRDAPRSNNSSSSSSYRNERHRGRQDEYRGGGGGGGGGYDRRDFHREKSGYSRGGGNYSPDNSYQQGRDRNDHEDDYDSYESDDGGRYASQTPHNKIVVRGLAQHITEADIVSDLMQFNLKPVSIRLIRRKNTGASRGFAFVEFSTEEEATRWMNYKQGVLMLDQYRAVMQYSNSRGGPMCGDRRGQQGGANGGNGANMDNITDWYCSKCLVFNFKRRENCFKCYASREESERCGDGWDEISSVLTKKIIFRNLDVLTNEEGVLTVMQDVLPLDQVAKISKILVCRDPLTNTSRGICYLCFDTLVDSMNVHNGLQALDPPLTIDERNVGISYCVDGTAENQEGGEADRNSWKQKGIDHQQQQQNYYDHHHPQNEMGPSLPDSSADMHSVQSGGNTYQYTLADVPRLAEYGAKTYATNAAEHEHYYKYYTEYYRGEIEAGNFANLPMASQLGAETANSGAAVAQSAMQRKQLQQGKKAGQQRHPTTYEAGTSYVDPNTQQQMYWDGENWTYPAAGVATTTTKTAANSEPEAKEATATMASEVPVGRAPDKVKHAKNIVKDMEKWAKQLNQKKSIGGGGGPLQLPVPVKEEHPLRPGGALTGGAVDVGFAILEKKETNKIPLTPQIMGSMSRSAAPSSAITAAAANKNIVAYEGDSDHEGGEQDNGGFVANEKDYVDFKKLTCLLCQRAFQSEEILRKHIKMSDLHKQNLAKYKAAKGALGGSSADAESYRDRAKERRQKYGEADPPPLNKSRERFQKEIEKQASAAALAAASASVAQTPIGGGNVGNKLLQKMGWKDGQGLGRANQGRTNIIEVESRAGGAGLGTKSAGPPWAGGDYKSYIKKMMKQRYEQTE